MLAAIPLLFAFFQEADLAKAVKSFVDVYALVEREAADEIVPSKAFYEGVLPGMLRRLDPSLIFYYPFVFPKHLFYPTKKNQPQLNLLHN